MSLMDDIQRREHGSSSGVQKLPLYRPISANSVDCDGDLDEEVITIDTDTAATIIIQDIVVRPAWTQYLWRPLLGFSMMDEHDAKDYAEKSAIIKLIKLILLTFVGIFSMFGLIRWMDWEYKGSFHLYDFWVYESKDVAVDMIVFFIVGRLYKSTAVSVDNIAWLSTALLANIYASGINNFRFLQHSFTLYEMHCTWSWKLWVFCIGLTATIASVVFLHLRYMIRHGELFRHALEFVLCTLVFVLPFSTSIYFHFHHWFAGWLLGMHANLQNKDDNNNKVWWSRLCMAWCWGLYVNGIAAYGRDPTLTCGYTYWIAQQQSCPYLDCYEDALIASPAPSMWNNTAPPTISPMIPPDWRNCSASSYHP